MSLADIVSSTVSTVISDIFVLVNDNNDNNNNIPNNNIHHHHHHHNKPAVDGHPGLPAHPTAATFEAEGVADGVSPEKLIAVKCILAVFSIFGSLGNGLVLYVFTKKSDKLTSTIFILALAWTDFFTCLIIMPFTIANIALNDIWHLDFLCKTYHFLITSNLPLSAFIMVAIAVDRYFSICHPFMRVVTPRRARISIICLVLVACVLGSITASCFRVSKASPKANITDPDYSDPWDTNLTMVGASIQHVRSDDHLYNSSLHKSTSVTTAIIHDEITSKYTMTQTPLPPSNRVQTSATVEDTSMSPVGTCTIDDSIFSTVYQKIYISFYIISLLAVLTLYFFIYRSVSERREWRRKQKSFTHTPMVATTTTPSPTNGKKLKTGREHETEHLELAPRNHQSDMTCGTENGSRTVTDSTPGLNPDSAASSKSRNHENGVDTSGTSMAEKKANRERRDFNFLANIRTALMLFVVTLVFLVSFLPAWLMATNILAFEIIVFYMHFIYNVANPVIYAFMNQAFRKELKRVFQRGCFKYCCVTATHSSRDRKSSRTCVTAVSTYDLPE